MNPLDEVRDRTVSETCAILNVTAPTVYKLLAGGQLEGYKIGRSRRVTGTSIQRLRCGRKMSAA